MRSLSDSEAEMLEPGAEHYRAYVGPPREYDLLGGTQLALLLTLGLRGHHRLLDFGCGSLRAGRLLIPYLDAGNYYGVEPNKWLVEDGLRNQLGTSIVDVKHPRFFAIADFRVEVCGAEFDYIVAQSIFSHAGPDLVATALSSFKSTLRPQGLVLVTILHPEHTQNVERHRAGWLYPECMSYAPQTFQALIAAGGLAGRPLPWFHPRQTWYALAHEARWLPPYSMDCHLRGVILRSTEWRGSFGQKGDGELFED